MQQGKEGSSWYVLRDYCKLTWVIQASTNKLDDTGVIESAQDGNFTTKHVNIWFGTVRVGSVAKKKHKKYIKSLKNCILKKHKL